VDKTAFLLQIEQGKTDINDHNYLKAILSFRVAAQKDPENWRAPFWLAKAHEKLNNFGYMLKYAEQTLSKDTTKIDPEIFFLMAKANHHLGNLKEAISYYDLALARINKKDVVLMEVPEQKAQAEFALKAESQPKFAEKVALPKDVNSGNNDYGAILSNDGKTLYFTSRRSNTTGRRQNPFDDLYYEDIYRAVWNSTDDFWDSISNEGILKRVNRNGFESMTWLSPDEKEAYLTINNSAVDEKIKTKSSDIFYTKKNSKGDWGNPRPVEEVNSTGFDAGATLTADGTTMYFVSDRNLKKGSDIYVSHLNGRTWSVPVALSDTINTKGNETTPYITPDGKYLFFSSDYLPGMGGYDIFVSKNIGNDKWSKPVNLGATINTVNSDTHFQYYADKKLALFASRILVNQKSDIDIFKIDMTNFKFPE